MRRLILAVAVVSGSGRSEPSWLTIAGDATDAAADTIQVNPVALRSAGAQRVMEVRVSRGRERVSTDAVRFRSFLAKVEFDCAARTARFVEAQFYADPLWATPTVQLAFTASTVRPMEFRGFVPNPRDRLLRAACADKSTR